MLSLNKRRARIRRSFSEARTREQIHQFRRAQAAAKADVAAALQPAAPLINTGLQAGGATAKKTEAVSTASYKDKQNAS